MRDMTPGRLIRQSIAEDAQFNSLSTEAQLLYLLLRPHFSAHGKMKADPFLVKGAVVPLNPAFSQHTIARCLEEISLKTRVKLFKSGGIQYLHDLDWERHQVVRKDRGRDRMPGYPAPEPTLTHAGALPGMRTPLRSAVESLPKRGEDGAGTERDLACRPP